MEQYMPSSTTDFILITILGLSAIFAMYRGFIREVLAIFSWIASIFITIYLFSPTDMLMKEIIPNDMIAHGLSAILLFIVSLITFSLLSSFVADFIHKTPLSSVDRLLGLGFGVLRGGLVICLLYFGIAWAYAGKEMPGWVTKSSSLPIVQRGADYLTTLVPEDQRMKFIKMVQEVVLEKEDVADKTLGKPVETGPIIKKIEEKIVPPEDTEIQGSTQDIHDGKRALDDPVHVENKTKKGNKDPIINEKPID